MNTDEVKQAIVNAQDDISATRTSIARMLCDVSHIPTEERPPFLKVARIKQALDAIESAHAMMQQVIDDARPFGPTPATIQEVPTQITNATTLRYMVMGRAIRSWLRGGKRKIDVLLAEVTDVETHPPAEYVVTARITALVNGARGARREIDIRRFILHENTKREHGLDVREAV